MENAESQIMVTKSDGRIVPFDPNKIIKVLHTVGADEQVINLVLSQIDKIIYDTTNAGTPSTIILVR